MARWSVGRGRALTAAVFALALGASARAQVPELPSHIAPPVIHGGPGGIAPPVNQGGFPHTEYHDTGVGTPHFVDSMHGVRDLTPDVLPPLALCGDDCHDSHVESGIYGWAEYLLIRPRRRALDYALVDPANNLTPEGTIQSVLWDTRSAFRTGLGYRTRSGWEVGGSYTYLRSSDQTAVLAPAGGVITPLLTRPGLVDMVSAAAADARLRYDLWDIEVGRRVRLDESFDVRFSTGMMFAAIDQELRGFYDGRDATRAVAIRTEDFFGVGPFIGGSGDWLLPGGFFVFGAGRVALTVGDVTSRYFESDNGGLTTLANVAETYTHVVPMAQLGLGVGWQRGRFSVRTGYELTNWFGLIDRPYSYDDFAEGKIAHRGSDLSLEGFFIRMGWAY